MRRRKGARPWTREDLEMSAWDFEDRGEAEAVRKEEQSGDEEQQAEAPRTDETPQAAEEHDATGRDEPTSMDDVDLDDAGPVSLKPGDIVKGVVVAVNEDGVLVDVGGKAEGIVPMYEFLDRADMPECDDDIEVAVVKLQDDEEMTILSKKRADYERVWNRVMSALDSGEILDAMVTDRVKGGLRVDLGVSGFVPASHVATRDVRNLDRFVGRSLRLKVLEADRERKKVVLSHRLVVEEERKHRREDTMAKLHEGLVCEGKVRNITDYGAFIDLGGVDGLLHVSEMSWGRVAHPSDVCGVGDTLRVVVLDIDQERDRISLGRRQILPDPWNEVGKALRPGSTVTGRVNRIVRTGAFVELTEFEVEGFLPVGELSDRRVETPSDVIEEGQELQLQVLKLRPQARRMTLSLVAAMAEKERQEYQRYMADQEEPKTTLGDRFADVLGAVAAELDGDEAAPAVEKLATEAGEPADSVEVDAAETPDAADEGAAEAEGEGATEAEEEGAAEAEEEGAAEAEVVDDEAAEAEEEEAAEAEEEVAAEAEGEGAAEAEEEGAAEAEQAADAVDEEAAEADEEGVADVGAEAGAAAAAEPAEADEDAGETEADAEAEQ